MITARQFAELHATPYTTVATWLQRELIPGAEKQELPYGGYIWMVPQDAPIPELKPGPKTFQGRLKAIAAEILEELSDQYTKFDIQSPAQDSNDWGLTYKAHGGRETSVTVIRRSGQTDDEVKDEIRAQLMPVDDQGPTKPRRRASKRSSAKKSKKGRPLF